MAGPQAFVGDDEKSQRNLRAVMASCQHFPDFDKIDMVPAGQYLTRPAAA